MDPTALLTGSVHAGGGGLDADEVKAGGFLMGAPFNIDLAVAEGGGVEERKEEDAGRDGGGGVGEVARGERGMARVGGDSDILCAERGSKSAVNEGED